MQQKIYIENKNLWYKGTIEDIGNKNLWKKKGIYVDSRNK
jgi:hypothetical protein